MLHADFSTLPLDFYKDFDCVVLLAGHSSVKMCIGDLGDSFRNNVRSLRTLGPNPEHNTRTLEYTDADAQKNMVLSTAVFESDAALQDQDSC